MLAIEVKHITKSYAEKVAVKDLSLTVDSGEIFWPDWT